MLCEHQVVMDYNTRRIISLNLGQILSMSNDLFIQINEKIIRHFVVSDYKRMCVRVSKCHAKKVSVSKWRLILSTQCLMGLQ